MFDSQYFSMDSVQSKERTKRTRPKDFKFVDKETGTSNYTRWNPVAVQARPNVGSEKQLSWFTKESIGSWTFDNGRDEQAVVNIICKFIVWIYPTLYKGSITNYICKESNLFYLEFFRISL